MSLRSTDVDMQRPQFSIVVPTANRPEALRQCLLRLAAGGQRGMALCNVATGVASDAGAGVRSYEVIVSDDGDDADARTLIAGEFPWIRWTTGPRRGPAANRNRGAAAALGEWLAFTDDDCLPDPDWLIAFAEAAGPDDHVLEGRTYADRAVAGPHEVAPVNEHGGKLWSCNFAIRRNVFAALGGFDERFRFNCMEDVELRHRLGLQRVPVRFVPRASVCHPVRAVSKANAHRNHLEALRLFLALHPEVHRLPFVRHFARSALLACVAAIEAMSRGRWSLALNNALHAGSCAINIASIVWNGSIGSPPPPKAAT